MRIHLVNPSDVSFGTAVITPRWQYVLAAATPARHGTPILVDETLDPLNQDSVQPGDVVGIGIHTGMPCAGIGSDATHAGAGPSSCLAVFMRRCSPTRPASTVAPMLW